MNRIIIKQYAAHFTTEYGRNASVIYLLVRIMKGILLRYIMVVLLLKKLLRPTSIEGI